MALPGQPQTFAMDNCRDMLDKLKWEIEQIKRPTTTLDPMHVKCGCYNAAVTAWQLADWVFADASDDQKMALGISNLAGLQAKVRRECRELYLCRQLATASKHRKVTSFVDKTVDSGVQAETPYPLSGPVFLETWEAYVEDNGTKRSAIQVFEFALEYWTSFIYQKKIAA